MSIISIILGVLLIIAGVACMFTPFATFLSAGMIIAIMLFVYGIGGIVRFFRKESGALELLASILGIIVGIIAIIRPGSTLVLDRLVLTLVAVWLLVKGVINVIVSIKSKDEVPGWGWGVAAGVLSVIAGIIAFVNPAVAALTIGILMGLFFVECGIDMIVFGTALNAINR